MISKSTHIFKKVDDLDLKLDIYLPSKSQVSSSTAVLFLHGGGLVAFNRELLPPHIAQSCLIRGWPLISADYRLMPQASAQDILDDVISAYEFIQTKLSNILDQQEKFDIILVGSSAGSYLAYTAKPYLQPPPIAVLNYYGPPSCDDAFYFSNHVIGPSPIPKSKIEHFLTGPTVTGPSTPGPPYFDTSSLLEDFSRDPEWKLAPEFPDDGRADLYFWLVQENKFLEMLQDIDRGWESNKWMSFGKLIIVHGDDDKLVPYYMSPRILNIMGPENVQLFTGVGKPHAWDMPLFLGDPDLEVVEEAWKALDKIVAELNPKS